ncbi:MAG: sulfatase-like hydrolase/transferase [Planctomycetota bacterium]|jgi:hypothetical protein|nr:sulfatase-like hydrolase/transferase [Planctomycetota bacterium]MDP6942318.1 sulfatase-like hydrolase/transferase [Planctomycetota bacterium]
MFRKVLHSLGLGAVLAGFAGAIELIMAWGQHPHHFDPNVWASILPVYLFAGAALGWGAFIVSPVLTRRKDRSHHPGLQLAVLIFLGGACTVLILDTHGDPAVRLGIVTGCALLAHQALRLVTRSALGWMIATLFSPLSTAIGLTALLLSAALAWVSPSIPGPYAGPSGRQPFPSRTLNQNLVLIQLPGVNQDSVSCFGYIRNTTPTIDRIASEGVLFANATSTSPATPSIATNEIASHVAVNLRAGGWSTYGTLVGHSHGDPQKTLPGFSRFTDLSRSSLRQTLFVPKLRARILHWGQSSRNRPSTAVNHVIAWLTKRSPQDSPFFVSLELGSASPPHHPPLELESHFLPEGTTAKEAWATPPNPIAALALRDAEILEIDQAIRDLLDSLAHLDLLENTNIVICGSSLDSRSGSIPLILRCPANFSAGSKPVGNFSLRELLQVLMEDFGALEPELNRETWEFRR